MRFLASLTASLAIALSLTACAAPAPTPPATGDLAGQTPPPPPASPTPPTAPPKSTPYPPRVMPKGVAVDSSCRTSADCAIKDVGNCCGAMPACVNKDSPTDPAAVQAQCQAKGMMGVCGFREITACQCDNGQCVSAGPANPEPSSDPAEPVR